MVPDPPTETDPGDRRSPPSRRSRRSVLAATTTTAGAALAGCSSLVSRRLSSSVEHGGDGETSVIYTAGSSEVATATFVVSDVVDSRARFRSHLSQDLSGVERYRLRFRPVVGGSVPHFTVALERPGGYPFPTYRFQSAEGFGWTLFEVPDLGTQSSGSFTVDFWFDLSDDVERLGVQVDLRAALDAGLDPREYVTEALLTVHGPVSDGG